MNETSNLGNAAGEASTGAKAQAEPKRSVKLQKVLVLAAVIAVFGLTYAIYGDELSLTSLSEKEEFFRQYQQEQPVLVHAVALLVYVVVAGLSLPGAAALTLLMGWLFGFLGCPDSSEFRVDGWRDNLLSAQPVCIARLDPE